MTTIVVAGALANRPYNGGGADVRMTWVEGLRRLGCDVWFVEQIERARLLSRAPAAPMGRRTLDRSRRRGAAREESPAESPGSSLHYFRDLCARFGLGGRAALLDEEGARIAGVERRLIDDVADAADLLVNLGGHLRLPSLRRRFRRRAFVDLDPGFTQIWRESGLDGGGLEEHDAYFTVGLNVGRSGCGVPTCGLPWRPLPPPVLLEEEPRPGGAERAQAELTCFSTIGSWRGPFGRLERGGRPFALKAHEFRKVIDLPWHVPAPFEIALDIHAHDGRDLDALFDHGWRVVDPRRAVPDPDSYRRYIRRSGAEFSVAQGVYVETGSGWLSDRTARYLAAGKPALVQDTGLGLSLPVGDGLVPFRSRHDAIERAREIVRRYGHHSASARSFARRFLDARHVLPGFLDQALRATA